MKTNKDRKSPFRDILTYSFLQKEYVLNKKTTNEISDMVGCNKKTVSYHLKKFKIKRRGKTFIKNHKHLQKTLEKISKKKRGRHTSTETEFRKGIVPWNKGTKGVMKSNEGSFKKGERRSKETEFKQGFKPWNYKRLGWLVHTEEFKKKLSERMTGKNHPMWQGGVSFLPYPPEWTFLFKQEIRFRDNNQCQECGKLEINCKQKLHVHHIDYDKENIFPTNLISLCISCHLKTNAKRDYWYAYFTYIMEERDVAICR